jgi:hypothetical protein
MPATPRPIFKSHNPGCNCCPQDGGSDDRCWYTALIVKPVWYIVNFTGGQSSPFLVAGNHTSCETGKRSPTYWGGPINLSTYLVAYTWTAEGVNEKWGGSGLDGQQCTYQSAGASGPMFRSASASGGITPCSAGWTYPSWQCTQATDFDAYYSCRPAWQSPGAKLSCGETWYLIVSTSQVSAIVQNLEVPPEGSFTVRRLEGLFGPDLHNYDPNVYFPFEPC